MGCAGGQGGTGVGGGGTGLSREDSWPSPSAREFSEASHPGATRVPLSIASGCKAHDLWGLKLSGLKGRREGGQVARTQAVLVTHVPYSWPSWSAQVSGFQCFHQGEHPSSYVSVTQSCPALCDPRDGSPPGSSIHGDSAGKKTGAGGRSLLQGIFPTQGSNFHLLHLCNCRQILHHSPQWEACATIRKVN